MRKVKKVIAFSLCAFMTLSVSIHRINMASAEEFVNSDIESEIILTTSDSVTDGNTGTGLDETSGSGLDETSGSGLDETSGSGLDETSDSGLDETSGSGLDETSGSGLDETSGSAIDTTSGSAIDATSGSAIVATAPGIQIEIDALNAKLDSAISDLQGFDTNYTSLNNSLQASIQSMNDAIHMATIDKNKSVDDLKVALSTCSAIRAGLDLDDSSRLINEGITAIDKLSLLVSEAKTALDALSTTDTELQLVINNLVTSWTGLTQNLDNAKVSYLALTTKVDQLRQLDTNLATSLEKLETYIKYAYVTTFNATFYDYDATAFNAVVDATSPAAFSLGNIYFTDGSGPGKVNKYAGPGSDESKILLGIVQSVLNSLGLPNFNYHEAGQLFVDDTSKAKGIYQGKIPFAYDAVTKSYTFDSSYFKLAFDKNYQSGGSYEVPYTIDFTGKSGFQPLNYFNNNKKNLHFGMVVEKTISYGQNAVFTFAADDDLFVYLDGQLMVDIGGIHDTISKTITTCNSQIMANFADGQPHVLKVFYLERGDFGSSCKIQLLNVDLPTPTPTPEVPTPTPEVPTPTPEVPTPTPEVPTPTPEVPTPTPEVPTPTPEVPTPTPEVPTPTPEVPTPTPEVPTPTPEVPTSTPTPTPVAPTPTVEVTPSPEPEEEIIEEPIPEGIPTPTPEEEIIIDDNIPEGTPEDNTEELPTTGTTDVRLFYLVGLGVVAIGIGMLANKKKKEEQ